MAGKCSHPGCFDPDNTGCNIEGHSKLSDCKYYNKSESVVTTDAPVAEDVYYRIPWTGNTLGLNDLNQLTMSSKPIVIGITGVASAGKTTFLASLYCLLRHGKKIGDFSFAGSITLGGWESIAWYLSWKSNGNIQFPPHTTGNAGRVPGLLHLRLKDSNGRRKDLIFTDAPGEWFEYWRVSVNDENANGAKWIGQHSDAFMLFADCEILSGAKRGIAKLQIQGVADRIVKNAVTLPFALVWSKSDIQIPVSTKQQITDHLKQFPLTNYAEFATSVKAGENANYRDNICSSINWILEKLEANRNIMPQLDSLIPEDLFLSKRA
jgi:hypothetical protein